MTDRQRLTPRVRPARTMRPMLHDYRSITPAGVAAETDAALARVDALVDGAVGSAAAPSFEATLLPLDRAIADLMVAYGRGAFMGQVHPHPDVRDAGTAAEERITKWRVALVFRRDLYDAVQAFAATDEARALTGEPARLLEHWLRDFRRAGHELAEAERGELEGLRTRLVEIQVAFQRNVNEYRDGIDVTHEQLAGLPDSYVERLSPGTRDGTFRVGLEYPELNPFLEQAHDRSLRRELFMKHWSRAVAANRALWTEVLPLRHRIAQLMGQPTWAHHAMELKMAKAPERVRAFYDELLPALGARVERELATMAERLHADGHDGPVAGWDWRYYDEMIRRSEYGVDQERVSEYLPLDRVVDGMFAITGDVLGLDYREIVDARGWTDDVRLFEIRDRSSGAHVASFYLDLFPREGTFGHAAAWPLVPGHRGEDGRYVAPVSAIVANFTPPTGDRPSLLRHSEVETLWHEFGHALHMSLSRAEFARFSGAETEWDFVEAPSQIMEHWTWEPSVLARISGHWTSGEPMPPTLVHELRRARWLNVGLSIAVQAFYGQLDLAIHAEPVVPDLDEALRRTYQITGMPYPEGTFLLGGFDHLIDGYDAGYYGYLWAEVIGDDLFGRFAREGVTSARVGADYRREILEPNGSRDAEEMVSAFLGRSASNDAFLRLRGMG